MRKVKVGITGIFLLISGLLMAQNVNRTPQGVKVNVAEGNFNAEVIFYSPSIVRIVKYPSVKDQMPDKESLSVTLVPEQTKIDFKEQGDDVRLKTSDMIVTLNKTDGTVRFTDTKNNELLAEKGTPSFYPNKGKADKGTYKVRQAFMLEKEEAIYGLGILQNGKMSQRNQRKYLMPGNVEDGITFFQSVKGYGLFWDNYSPTNFADDENETSFESEVGDCTDYYFMYGGDADGVVAQMRTLTGQVPMFPLWTYGYWQSKERYKSQNEVLGVLNKYRELQIPLDGIVQDWQYWGSNYLWNAMEFLDGNYYNPQQMLDEIHAKNAHMIITIWSSFGPQTKPYKELNEKGLLFNFRTWPLAGTDTWPPREDYLSGVRVYDAYSPVARDIYWKHLTRLYDLGMDGWWMDSTEPDHLDAKPEDFDTPTYLGSFRKVRSAYPLMAVGGVYDHQRATTSDKRVFILTRSGFAGQQRYGCNVWSGDIVSTWESLRKQIPAGLNFTLTGNPNFNSDIGGFFLGHYNKGWNDGSATKNPSYQELYVRWVQFGAFNPMMRSHGTEAPREIYQFGKKGEPIYDAIEKAIRLRYSLLPYIYSTSWQVTNKQSSFMRALMMDFADDEKVWDMNDEYMFGKSILVAPIVEAQYTPEVAATASEETGWDRDDNKNKSKGSMTVDFTTKKTAKVYLPAGTVWYDFWTNEKYDGGQEISREATIDMIPLYVRAGSIVPIGPDVQYATEKAWDNLELKVYAGANGSFTLYEDEFDNYNYESGAYTEIPMTWNNASRTLTIGARKGKYNGMLEKRQFTVKTVDGNSKTVTYTGKKVTVKL